MHTPSSKLSYQLVQSGMISEILPARWYFNVLLVSVETATLVKVELPMYGTRLFPVRSCFERLLGPLLL
jgi:hypothetical protein